MTSLSSRYASMTVPRYTSYPTVPHFSADVGEADYRGWLAGLDPAEPISLYLHVPFCSQLCWYCGCNMKLASRYEPVAAYLDTLLVEVDLLAEALPARMRVSHLHWGGGTPTSLSPEDLERAMTRLRGRFDFQADAELAIECDPRSMTSAMAERIGALGFNRASFGVQEFDPEVQRAINRIQPPEMVADCVSALRRAGVAGINFDLIYGLPHQTVARLEATIAKSAEIGPDRIALFGYAHVPWMAKKQRLIDADALPGADERLAQAKAAAAALVKAGYRVIGLDHFAKPEDELAKAAAAGTLRRNFQGYTTDLAETLLGLGSTSIGRTSGGFVQNIAETGAWSRAVTAGHLPIAKGIALSPADRLRAAAIEALMCFGTVDVKHLARAHAVAEDWAADAMPLLQEMASDGLLTLEEGRITLTEAGQPLVRIAAAVFDSYRAETPARHSVAV
ncbi:MAG: oxygen-independent coproporphyrinogen III oxidase [Kiloniellales bacterium]